MHRMCMKCHLPYSGFLPLIEKTANSKTATQILAIQGERENKVTRLFNLKNGNSLSVMNEECCVVCSRRILHVTETRPCRLK